MSEIKVRLYGFIDVYPDFTAFIVICVASIVQIAIGNKFKVVVSTLALLLPSLVVLLPTNILLKKVFKTTRPKCGSCKNFMSGAFEHSFPSFHSQFSAGEAITFLVGIILFSSENIRFVAAVLAIIVLGIPVTLVAFSRVALRLHNITDVIGGIVIGIIIGFAASYSLSKLIWNFSLIIKLIMASIFVIFTYALSNKMRKM